VTVLAHVHAEKMEKTEKMEKRDPLAMVRLMGEKCVIIVE
jgi:hypothetical protein